MFNILKHSDSEDKNKTEPTAKTADILPEAWEPTPGHPAAPASLPVKLPEKSENDAQDAFPTLAVPNDAPAPQPETAPESVQSAGPKSTPYGDGSVKPLYPPLPQKPNRKNALEYMFSTETGSGRIIRGLLRWLAAFTGLFALGLLAGYLMLYQPTQIELDAAQLKLKQASQSASQKDQTLLSAQADRTQVQQSLQQAQSDLKKAASENDLLMVMVSVSNARVALVNKDGPTAKAAIEQAQADLAKTQAFIDALDKTKFDVLKTRLDLTAKELVGDPQAAQTDLDKLAVDLTDLRQKLFKK